MFDTMTREAKRRIPHKEHAGREPVAVTISVVILGVLVLTCAALLVPPLWTAVEGGRFSPGGQDCGMIEDATARQACDEELSARAARHPAKGANAPLILRPSEQRSD
jgi:hypothetical protein